MHWTRFRLALAALALLGAGTAVAQVTVNGAPATISAIYKIVWNGQDISNTNALPVAVVSGGGGGGGGGDASAANQQTQINALGNPADAAYPGTGNGNNISLGKGQYAILGNLLGANGAIGDAASATIGANGSQIALQKAIRDKLLGTISTARPDKAGSGTLALATQDAAIVIPVDADGTLALSWGGLSGSGAIVSYEQVNGASSTYTTLSEFNTGTNLQSATRTTDGNVRVPATGHSSVRLRVSTPGTGTATVSWKLSQVPFALWCPNCPTPQTAGAAPTGTGLRAMGNDGAAVRDILVATTGALEPLTAAAGKITRTSTALTANTSTTIAAANANRVALGLQCGSGGVSVDETGGALTAAGVGNGTLFLPSGTGPYFTPPVATRAALTAYTATAQTCVVTEYLR